MATLVSLGSSTSVLRFHKPDPLKAKPSLQLLGSVTSQLSGIKISYNFPDVSPVKPISSPLNPALQPVARKSFSLLCFKLLFVFFLILILVFTIEFLGMFQFYTFFCVALSEISLWGLKVKNSVNGSGFFLGEWE